MDMDHLCEFADSVRTDTSGPFCEAVMKGMNACFESVVRPFFEGACSNSVLLEGHTVDPDAQIFKNIREGIWDTTGDIDHDYPIFMESLLKSKHKASLTIYSLEQYREKGARLYKVAGYDAGFAVTTSGEDPGDIISVHNNSEYANVAPDLIKKAIEYGGDHFDHYAFDRLNEVYGGAGFDSFARYPWDDQYAPKDWDYEKDGTPDVIMRGLPYYIARRKASEMEGQQA